MPLQSRISMQYPVALIDEFQDTSPDQYAIFDALYKVADNNHFHGLFLIGDPKQSIYGFRGADIHSYLSARRATEGRHYLLGTNFRSTEALVAAVNTMFEYAEGVVAGEGEHEGKVEGEGERSGCIPSSRSRTSLAWWPSACVDREPPPTRIHLGLATSRACISHRAGGAGRKMEIW